MTIAAGTIEYSLSTAKSYVKGTGLSLLLEELDAALEGPVANSVFDEEGIDNLTTLLESVVDTEFDRQEIKRVLESNKGVESWRVGEALAESYLDHHRDCHFPWPDSRDERKSGSSLPGADLVGLQQKEDELRFAFGEYVSETLCYTLDRKLIRGNPSFVRSFAHSVETGCTAPLPYLPLGIHLTSQF